MKKIKFVPVYLLLLVLCSMFVVSCSEDKIVTQTPAEPYQYDSARFDWKVDTLYGDGYYAGLWAPDTNELFITNVFTNQLVHIKNGVKTYSQYPLLGEVLGDEMNNGYLVAAILIDTIYQPFLQKYDGNNFIDIPVPQNLDKNFFFHSVFIKNSTEMWFGLSGEAIKFDGISFNHFPLDDSTMEIKKFYFDEENNLNFLSTIYHQDFFGGRVEFFIYRFNGNKWDKIYNDLETPRPLLYDIINRFATATNLNTIYELRDSILIPKINIPVPAYYFSFGGTSFNNITIAAAERFQKCNASLFNWNGNKWSIELCGYSIDFYSYFLTINENYFYTVSYDFGFNKTFIMKGTRKIN